MLRVGLTGGIACGKSRVLSRLAARGFHALDLDRIAHEVMAPGGAAHADVIAAFGPRVLAADGGIDRKALGAIVFADASARGRLNAIVHPRVREEEARRAAVRAANASAVVVSDAALLVEAGVHLRFDRLVVVHCRPEQQVRRLMDRDGIHEGAARARIAAQMPVEEKRRFAHYRVDTSGRLDETDERTDAVATELAALASRRGTRIEVPLDRAVGCLMHGPARGPRGLEPVGLARAVAAAKGLEMAHVARQLVPPADGPWYLASRAGEGSPCPAALAAPVVLWALSRGAPDPPFLLAAVASLARLTHQEAGAIAEATLQALALQEVAAEGCVPGDLTDRLSRWSAELHRWGGSAPALRGAVLSAAVAHPTDVAAARAACAAAGGDPDLAGALVGMAVGASPGVAPAPMVDAVRALLGPES